MGAPHGPAPRDEGSQHHAERREAKSASERGSARELAAREDATTTRPRRRRRIRDVGFVVEVVVRVVRHQLECRDRSLTEYVAVPVDYVFVPRSDRGTEREQQEGTTEEHGTPESDERDDRSRPREVHG